jgi:class I fructose-bisphosphate aldolase
VQGFSKVRPPPAGPRLHRSRGGQLEPQSAGPAQLPVDHEHRPPRRHRLHLDTARRPGHRALRRRQLRAESDYFDPENIVKLAIEGGCNAVASTFGVLAAVSRKYAHKIPFLVKLNHNELLTYPNTYDQVMYGSVAEAYNLGACAVGATIYFGSDNADRQIQEVSEAFEEAHALGMVTVLWCYLRNSGFKVDGTDYHVSADGTGQANHLGVTIQADIIKQKQAENNGLYNAVKFGKTHPAVYEKLTPGDHPIELCRYQLACCYNGRAGLINSGGASGGANDLQQAVRTAVINKRAGGMGLISGRKAFQRPMEEGIGLLNAIQDVYTDESITLA